MADLDDKEDAIMDEQVRSCELLRSGPATRSLRVTCYGSSSSTTPERYLREARTLGYLLAKRGHTCVNGAGSFGCMAAMNDGAVLGEGHIVGVIHEMWLVDQQDWASKPLRDGGAHPALTGRTHPSPGGPNAYAATTRRPIREILVAGGKDLQQRKRMLVEHSNGLIVLPGGPGTFDELWEMACARNIGLKTALPIVCINVDGYYDPFRQMLERAYNEKLTKLRPEEIIHFVSTAEAAVQWIEQIQDSSPLPPVMLRQRKQQQQQAAFQLRQSSFLSGGMGWDKLRDTLSWLPESLRSSLFYFLDDEDQLTMPTTRMPGAVLGVGLVFCTGLVSGFMLARRYN